jgi:hypothetical protein
MLCEVPNYVKRSSFVHGLPSVSSQFTAHNSVCSPGKNTHRQTAFFLTAGALRPNEPVFQAVSHPELCGVNIAKSPGKHAKNKANSEYGETNFT